MPALPDSLLSGEGPSSPRQLNPAAVDFDPSRPGRAAAAAAAKSSAAGAAPPSGGGGPSVVMPPVVSCGADCCGNAPQCRCSCSDAPLPPTRCCPTHPPLPQLHSIFGNIEHALAGRSFVPAWDRMHEGPQPGQPLVVAEPLGGDSSTEGGCGPRPGMRGCCTPARVRPPPNAACPPTSPASLPGCAPRRGRV